MGRCAMGLGIVLALSGCGHDGIQRGRAPAGGLESLWFGVLFAAVAGSIAGAVLGSLLARLGSSPLEATRQRRLRAIAAALGGLCGGGIAYALFGELAAAGTAALLGTVLGLIGPGQHTPGRARLGRHSGGFGGGSGFGGGGASGGW